ncbi:hypothetical protein [Rhodohalobacter mucosus]|uniref:ABC-2 type transport system permease protein n=1 Tax=Rhodohalobacter mucosus TaxID=2079485 RepID=A0A316TTH5_9BACT|nr:hypothetical protein [Rhodohalobacter mucosus]PWN06931.1 hypothetical protein DDZ15_06565 [Rhodohalobacter mucosus]
MSTETLIRNRSITRNAALILLATFAGLIWAGDYSFDERVVTLRYLLFALSGLIAFITPYLLFPDPGVTLVQLANLTKGRLIKYIVSRYITWQWPLLLLIASIILGDTQAPFSEFSNKLLYAFYGVFLFVGLNLISLSRYLRSGSDSQFWQESEKGLRIRKQVADYMKYPLDPGSIPSMINTIAVSVTGMMAVVAGAFLGEMYGSTVELLTAAAVLILGLISFVKLRVQTALHYYATNAFYNEFFNSGSGDESTVERRKADQLWWVPFELRAGVWQFLQQIDRKIPAGRAVLAGHFLIWFVAYQRPGEEFITVLWIIFSVVHHLFILLTMQKSMAPNWLLRWIDSPFNWFLIRFWMQLRWLVPLFVSMNAQLFVFGYPKLPDQLTVMVFYLLSGALLSAAGVFRMKRSVQ